MDFAARRARSEEALFDGDDVARVYGRVLVHALGRPRPVVLADDEDLVLRRALLEAAGERHGLAHREPRDERVPARPLDLAVDEEIAVLVDRHRDLRIDEVAALQAVPDHDLE